MDNLALHVLLIMLELLLPDFHLTLTPLEPTTEGSGGPYLDWINLQVSFKTAGLSADFRWDVMPSELQSFGQQLESIHLHPTSEARAMLQSVESGLLIKIDSRSDGNIIIAYSLQPTPPDGPILKGITGADQSYLPSIINSIDQLIDFH